MLTTKKFDDYFQREQIGTNSKEMKEWVEAFQVQKSPEKVLFDQFSIFCQDFLGIFYDWHWRIDISPVIN